MSQTYFVATVRSGVTGEEMPFRTPLGNGLSGEKFAAATISGIRNAGATVLEYHFEYGIDEERQALTDTLKSIPIRGMHQGQYEAIVDEIVQAYSW
jgi:hypothetical protein